jgi:hypothetical protein
MQNERRISMLNYLFINCIIYWNLCLAGSSFQLFDTDNPEYNDIILVLA